MRLTLFFPMRLVVLQSALRIPIDKMQKNTQGIRVLQDTVN